MIKNEFEEKSKMYIDVQLLAQRKMRSQKAGTNSSKQAKDH